MPRGHRSVLEIHDKLDDARKERDEINSRKSAPKSGYETFVVDIDLGSEIVDGVEVKKKKRVFVNAQNQNGAVLRAAGLARIKVKRASDDDDPETMVTKIPVAVMEEYLKRVRAEVAEKEDQKKKGRR